MPGPQSWTELVRGRLAELDCDPARGDEVIEELADQLEDVYLEARARGLGERAATEEALSQVPDWKELATALARELRPRARSRFRRWPAWPRRESMRSGLANDVRHGLRLLAHKPGFTFLAVLALSLGIGANTVAFTFVKAMLFGSLPVREPQTLIRIYGREAAGMEYSAVSYADYLDLRERAGFLDGILLEKLAPLNLGTERGSERIWGYVVSGGYFDVLGVAPALGSFFHEESESEKQPFAVLGYGFWKSAFGSDPGVIGETVRLNGYPFTIVAVAPESFTGSNVALAPALWAPASMTDELIPGYDLRDRRYRGFQSLARLSPGIGVEEARRRLDVIARGLEAELPDSNRGFSFSVLPESEGGVHPIMRGGLVGFSGMLVTVVVLVLVLACANVAGLLLARGFHRRKETSLRLALGATRGRLVRQLLTESVLLSLVAGVVGIGIAWGALRVFSSLRPPTDIPIFLPLSLDGRILSFTVGVTLATGILFGLAPALQASRPALVPALKEGRGGGPSGRSVLRSALVVGQIALTTVLLVGTGLFLRSLGNAHDIDLGFDPRGVVMASVDLGLQHYEDERGRVFFRQLSERLRAIPGVESVGCANMIPFDFNINTNDVAPEGYQPPPGGGYPSVDRNVVSAGYFTTMRVPLLDGRDFSETDTADSPPVVIINETLARRFWPDDRAVGKRLGRTKMYEVVGVVGDGKYLTLGEEPRPVVFYPHSQRNDLDMTFVLRSRGEPEALLDQVREVFTSLDPDLPVYNAMPLPEHLRIALAPAQVGAALLGSFGLLALILASIGLYGIVAFRVAQQTFEIGIRRALGARPSDIVRSVLKSGMILALAGLGLGLLASAAASRLAVSLLYGTSALDPIAFAGAPLVLASSALVACLVPALRALGVDPIEALHYE
jgi:putative ABC transport system permease protein